MEHALDPVYAARCGVNIDQLLISQPDTGEQALEIAETLVRKVSEMAGDRPLILSLALYIVLSLLYTTLGGLGSIMMLGSIVLPIMISLGITPLAALPIAPVNASLLFAIGFVLVFWGIAHLMFKRQWFIKV